MAGKVAVVTGGGRHGGLGEGIATAFAGAGAHVVIADIGAVSGGHFPEHGVATRGQMADVAQGVLAVAPQGVRVLTAQCDVRVEAQVRDLVAFTVENLGGIDVLVNNAGVGYLMSPVVDMAEDDWDVVLDVNLKGMFLCTKHAAARMVEQGRGGRIINISSQGGKSGFPFASAYCASKHGVIGFTRSVAIEFGGHGITVNAVCPNHVTTGLGAWQNEYFSERLGLAMDEYLAAMRARIPLGRTGTPQDTANACLWLAGDGAAYVTGESINVSGGEETH
jgi:meso-butanediol dehydrogenase/(S,S)-butanediol dehydrogenase/diacetyl reductase